MNLYTSLYYSLKDGKGIVFVNACQINDIHSINWWKISAMVAFKHLFCQSNHFLYGNVESTTNSFEKTIYYVKVYHQYVSIYTGFHLETFVFSEKCKQKISKLLSDWLQINVFLVYNCFVDTFLNKRLAFVKFIG